MSNLFIQFFEDRARFFLYKIAQPILIYETKGLLTLHFIHNGYISWNNSVITNLRNTKLLQPKNRRNFIFKLIAFFETITMLNAITDKTSTQIMFHSLWSWRV